MRPLTATRPKPMVPVAGKPLIDHALDKLAEAGVARAVVNVHYMADHILAHMGKRKTPAVTISDERALLETGGGMVKAYRGVLPDPFFALNSDNVWLDGPVDVFRTVLGMGCGSDGCCCCWCAIRTRAIIAAWAISASIRWAGLRAAPRAGGALHLYRHPDRIAPPVA
jgi:hypothetical protein